MTCLIEFSSITFAQRVKESFRYSGHNVSLTHTPSALSRGSCSYSVRAEERILNRVIAAAEEMDIRIRGIYKELGNGRYENYIS